jgi:hypothetical protein
LVMFCGYLNADLWKMFTELSYFYRKICVKQVSKTMMQKFEKEILVLVCKIEKVFLPGWFNAMHHLLVHLPWEAVKPRSEKEGTKPPYVCPECANHTHGNNMINRGNVTNKQVLFLT